VTNGSVVEMSRRLIDMNFGYRGIKRGNKTRKSAKTSLMFHFASFWEKVITGLLRLSLIPETGKKESKVLQILKAAGLRRPPHTTWKLYSNTLAFTRQAPNDPPFCLVMEKKLR